MPTSVSIIIPTHNRAASLARALDSLRHIHIPLGVTLELLVIANACTDSTSVLVNTTSLPFYVRCIHEEHLGLNHARNRGLRESHGEILAFLDDDVSVDPGWIAGLLDVFHHSPAAIVAGKVTLCWQDIARPRWMDRRSEHLLSCVDYGKAPLELHHAGLAVGANFAFSRHILDSTGSFATTLDRSGTLLLGGGDTDFLARALASGHRLFYAPHASVRHHVAPHRASTYYLFRVSFGNGLTRAFFAENASPRALVAILIEYAYRFLIYSVLASLCTFLGLRKAAIHHHIRRHYSRGLVRGTWRRLRGLSPTGIRLAPAAAHALS